MLIMITKDEICSLATVADETSEGYEREMERLTAEGFAPVLIERSAVPVSREFRNAWKVGSDKVDVDMPTARTIHMDRIRKARAKALTVKDVEYLLADEAGNATAKATIAAQKQALRDIPQTFDLSTAATPEELTALWPDGLER